MRTRPLMASLALFGLAWLPGLAQANDYFLLFETPPAGINLSGESVNADHRNWIDVTSWSWGIQVASGGSSGSGAGVGKPQLSDFSWMQGLDTSVPGLFLTISQGKHVGKATLDVTRADGGGRSTSFFQMVFDTVLPDSLNISGSGSETVAAAFAYDMVTMRYRPQDAKGGYGDWIEGSFSAKGGAVNFSGNQQVLMGLFRSGGEVALAAIPAAVPEPSAYVLATVGLGLLGAMTRRRRLTRS